MPLIARALIEKDRHEYFGKVNDPSLSFEALVEYYISYLGAIAPDQKDQFKRRFVPFLAARGRTLDDDPLLAMNGDLNQDFVKAFFPHLSDRYYRPATVENCLKLELFPATDNELRNDDVPPPFNHRSARLKRFPFAMFIRRGGTLLASPQGYQYFDESLGCYWPHASTRAYSKSLGSLPRASLSGLVFLIQDNGLGTNFAHFTFDWVTRIMHALSLGVVDKDNSHFIMGGDRKEYHDIIIGILKEKYSLREEQFIFPTERVVLDIDGTFVFFSDQHLWPMHPAQMGHPSTMAFFENLRRALPPVPPALPERLFISRADANMRRIGNEAELIALAVARGFEVVRLSEWDAQRQIDLVRSARIVAGAHGMGFTHMIFSDGPLSLVEMFHPRMGTDAYALMARARRFPYKALVGEKVEDGRNGYRIEPGQFAAALDQMIEQDAAR